MSVRCDDVVMLMLNRVNDAKKESKEKKRRKGGGGAGSSDSEEDINGGRKTISEDDEESSVDASDRLFQVIDLDPYGTAAPFLDSAVQVRRFANLDISMDTRLESNDVSGVCCFSPFLGVVRWRSVMRDVYRRCRSLWSNTRNLFHQIWVICLLIQLLNLFLITFLVADTLSIRGLVRPLVFPSFRP